MTPNTPESEYLKPISLVPQAKLNAWLDEFYGKRTKITFTQILRHRDFSYVARIFIEDALPKSIIFKLVLPPWHIEQDIIERILIPSIAHSPQIYMTAHYNRMTALFIEDFGPSNLLSHVNAKIASYLGESLAKFHRSYCYRVDEIAQLNILNMLTSMEIPSFVENLIKNIETYNLQINSNQLSLISNFANNIANALAPEPISLIHGDFYAENIIYNSDKLHFIDWSWFTAISFPLLDLASIISHSPKNGQLTEFKQNILESYCFESGRFLSEIINLLPYAHALNKLLFLNWLILRKNMGIEGTTVGPVNDLMVVTINEINEIIQTTKE